MRIRSKYLSAAFKAATALSAWAGILLQIGVFSGEIDLSSLRYYTLISNVLIALYFSAATVAALRNKPAPLHILKGALMMGIIITGLVFHLLLASRFSMGGTQNVANQLLHTVTPILAVLDWLLFDEKGQYGKLSPYKWTIIPNVYFVLATIYGFTSGVPFYGGSRFPYYFMDYDIYGVWKVLLYVLAINAAFIALGYVFVLLDKGLARLNTNNQTNRKG